MANLHTKLIYEIKGNFIIPSYQRGYRWGKEEITRMLDDIYKLESFDNPKDKNYCLQPIVVKKDADQYELIDGQQRLTTIYLIYKYLNKINSTDYKEPKFSLTFENRKESTQFLKNIDMNKREETIDTWFMANAYEIIEDWFEKQADSSDARHSINSLFVRNVKIIWYEVEFDDKQESITMFTRLNVGKIALTSAELVKALFLRRDNDKDSDDEISQNEIALQWDYIETELHNEKLWYFLTTEDSEKYQTKIDLILDLISEKPLGTKEKYYTYFYFDSIHNPKDEEQESRDLKDIWQDIFHTFLILNDWYNDSELYHKIGYLIASGYKPKDTPPDSKIISIIYKNYKSIMDSKGKKTKKDFRNKLDEFIKESVDYGEAKDSAAKNLRYNNAVVRRLLLLFNVESTRKAGRFPFDKFNFRNNAASWSLEHIHAQQSQGLTTEYAWREWLNLHLISLESLLENKNEALIEEIKIKLDEEKEITKEIFIDLHGKIITELSATDDKDEYINRIDNLALPDSKSNTALSNSVFDVKREKIIKRDMEGEFIPLCTKRVFLKYYTKNNSQLHFWTKQDRDDYITAINEVLANYLRKPIKFDDQGLEEAGGSDG